MSGRESIRNGIVVIVILIGLALATVLLPELMGGTSTTDVSVPTEAEVITLTLPKVGGLGGEVSLTSIQLLGILAGLVIVPVVVVGGGLAFATRLASNITEATKEESSSTEFEPPQSGIASLLVYKPNGVVANLIKKSGDKYKDRATMPMPEHKMPRWSVISTSIAFLMFAAFFGYLLNGTFYPDGEMLNKQGDLVNTTLYTVGGSVLFALLIILWRIRPQRLETESSDVSAIPWDSIAVLLTFLIVVGLGIGYIVYLNFPN